MIIIAALMFSIFFVEIHRFDQKWKLDFKPFNCASCMAAWIALALYFLPVEVTEIMAYMFTAGSLAPIMRMLFIKIYKILI
jgi:hypothetical protein